MKKHLFNQGLAPIIIILIVIVVPVVAGGVWYFTQKPKPQDHITNACPTAPRTCNDGTKINLAQPNCDQTCPEDTKSNETADWQTYRSEKYGFEIKYPENLFVKEESGSIDFMDCKEIENPRLCAPTIVIGILIHNTKLSLHDWFTTLSTEKKATSSVFPRMDKCDPICLFTSVSNVEGIYMDSIPALKFNSWVNATDGIVMLVKKSPNFIIELVNFHTGVNLATGTENRDVSDKLFNQILSTFKFIKSENADSEMNKSTCEYKKGEYEMRVYDNEGRVTGILGGKLKQEIPRSVYENGNVHVFFPQDGIWEYELYAVKEGNYKLPITNTVNGKAFVFNAVNIPIFPGQTHEYKVDWKAITDNKNGVTLLIDNDKDGKFEKTIPISDTEFTCKQYKEALAR